MTARCLRYRKDHHTTNCNYIVTFNEQLETRVSGHRQYRVKEKYQSSAEVDFIIEFKGKAIPIEENQLQMHICDHCTNL